MGLGKVSINRIPVAINQDLRALFLSTHISVDYTYNFFLTHGFEGTGLTVKGIKLQELLSIPFPLPPLAEQHRIVAKVDELMALLDRLETTRIQRETTRDRLTTASLTRLTAPETTAEVFPIHARFALDNLDQLTSRPEQIKALRQTILNQAVRGGLQFGASGEVRTVGKFRKLQNGYAFKSTWFAKSGIRLLRNANIGHGEVRWDDVVYLPSEREKEFERFHLREGDIVLALDRPFIVTGTKVARLKAADLPSLLLQRVGRFVETDKGLSDDYLLLWINSPHFVEQIDPGRSAGVPHISSRQVESAEIYIPPLVEQRRIAAGPGGARGRLAVEEQPAGDDGVAGAGVPGLEPDAHAELHVGGLELGASLPDAHEDAGERLDRAPCGGATHGDAELGEERFTGNGELQRLLPIP
jgi:type I restriction enzyme, S subunit